MNILKPRLLATLCLGGIMLFNSAFAAQNILYYYSEAGDYIGGGAEVSFNDSDGSFTVSTNYDNGASLAFHTPNYEHWWYLDLAAANNADMQAGVYQNAQRFPFQESGLPGLAFSGDGHGCNTLSGKFNVLEIVRDANGDISKLAVDFEQHCEGGQPALYGQVRYNSDVPLSSKPLNITLDNPLNSDKCVEATSPTGAAVTLEALGITDSTGGNALTFNWSTTTGATGEGNKFDFEAPLTATDQSPVTVTLTVTDLTNNSQKNVTKSVCVSDTTAPVIQIRSPLPGQVVRGDNLLLDVSIKDAVDKNIRQYEVQIGSNFTSPLDPRTGRSRQQVFDAPKADGSVATSITVLAKDGKGNSNSQTVTVNQIPPANRANNPHFWAPSKR